MSYHYTVASYLKERMEQLNIHQMFGVAGNYTAPLLDTILADSKSPITISGNSNELCAGYAADGYSRIKGDPAALYVTYSVGPFSLLNTIAGSYVEQVPVLLINGAPTNKEDLTEKHTGLLYSHTTGYQFVDIHMFRPITVSAERITNASQAPHQIDSALTAMLTHRRPVYLEVTEDVWRAGCKMPEGELSSGLMNIVTHSEVDEAVAATMKLISERKKAIFWAGIELERFKLQDRFLELLEVANKHHAHPEDQIPFITSALGKSVISEDHPLFEGCVTLTGSKIKELVGDDGVVIGIGAWTIGKDTENQNIRNAGTVLASHQGVSIGAEYYPLITLEQYIEGLIDAFQKAETKQKLRSIRLPKLVQSSVGDADNGMGYDAFFDAIGSWLTDDDVLVVDAGFPLIGAQNVKISARSGFVAQAAWLAIGYSVASATGVKCAEPDKRVMVAVGDGAFHETCQAVADQHAYGQNTVVFVLANGIYGIEQYIVNPNPFRKPPFDYKDKLLDTVYPYNALPSWNYSKIPDSMGGEGRKVSSPDELKAVLEEIRDKPDTNFVVEVVIPETSTPSTLWPHLNSVVGEDEIENENWPPEAKF